MLTEMPNRCAAKKSMSSDVNSVALVEGQPRTLSLREMLVEYIEHRREVTTRRLRFELRKAKERAHILEGYRIALDHSDAIIKLIRAHKGQEVLLVANVLIAIRVTL